MNVTATASSRNSDLLKRLGVDQPADYKLPLEEGWAGGEPKYDVVFDPMSYKYEPLALDGARGVIAEDGHYVNILSSGWAVGAGGMEEVRVAKITISRAQEAVSLTRLRRPMASYRT